MHGLQLDKYQEQPQLLDPYLEGIVMPLSALLRTAATAPAPDMEAAHSVSRLLWVAATVRYVQGCGHDQREQGCSVLACMTHKPYS